MSKNGLTERDIAQKENRIAQWEKSRTLPRITQIVRVMNNRTAAPGLEAME
ncbi:MAG: hypothetical protein WCW13_01785 [archaeon]|jgi:hypothetical protein